MTETRNTSRRTFLAGAAAVGTVTVLPFAARAGGHMANEFKTSAGTVTVHAVHHASVVLETPMGVVYIDCVGSPADYADFPAADYVLVTHQHGDHYNAEVLEAITGEGVPLVVNPAVAEMLSPRLRGQAQVLANGDSTTLGEITLDAIPAYNTTEERKNFHPKGRDNGYVLGLGDFRVYVSGDTEPVPEMLALKDIDLAFMCMNLPFTMTAEQAAEAVQSFRPTYVYPYHYRGRDGGTQDPQHFAELVGDASQVKFGDWYAPGELN